MFVQSENESIKVLCSRKFSINNQQIGERAMALAITHFRFIRYTFETTKNKNQKTNLKFLIDFYS